MLGKRSRWVLWLLIALFLASSCQSDAPLPPPAQPEPTYLAAPTQSRESPDSSDATPVQDLSIPWPTQGWLHTSPEDQGMDSARLAEMMIAIKEKAYRIDSVTVIRNGYMLADATIHPFGPEQKHPIHSCTKSIVSALIGIAIDQGHIHGTEQTMLSFFPERAAVNLDLRKQKITLEHILTMSAGWECRDSYLYRWRGLNQMRASGDWVQFMLDLPMVDAPGTRFEYCNGGSFLLSAILQESTGLSALAFAEQHLFSHLGISDVAWPSNPDGISIGWGELQMLPHDMAKIGYLYLNNGVWEGQRLIPAEWVRSSTQKNISATLEDGYGYQWWIDSSGYYMALGYAGQFIFVVPEAQIVTVFTSDLPDSQFYTPQNLLTSYILPAVLSNSPLPENPSALASLNASIRILSVP